MRISDWQNAIHQHAVDKGWWQGASLQPQELLIGTKLALVMSEACEALEELRVTKDTTTLKNFKYEHKGPYGSIVDDKSTDYEGDLAKPVGFASELADIVIRVFDLAGYLGIDLDRAIKEKHEYNLTRSYRHGNKSI